MRTIQVDEQVYSYIQRYAIPYEDYTPNDTLNRMFGLKAASGVNEAGLPSITNGALTKPDGAFNTGNRSRSKNADLRVLVREKSLQDGKILFLHDHSGQRIQGFEATVAGNDNKLLRNGKKYSMSELAVIGLKAHGYGSDAASGPRHWHTADGLSIREIWEKRQPAA